MDISLSGESDFFPRHFRMCIFKSIVEKNDVSDNIEAVSRDGKLIGIAEMTVDIELFSIRA